MSTKRSHILKQTCNFHLQVGFCDLLVGTKTKGFSINVPGKVFAFLWININVEISKTNERSLLSYVLYMLSCPTCLVPDVPSCPTWLVSYVPSCLTCLVPYVLSCPTYLVPYVLSCLTCLVPYVLWSLTCFVPYVLSSPSCFLSYVLSCLVLYVRHALLAPCTTCSRALRALVPYVSRVLCGLVPRALWVLFPYVAYCQYYFEVTISIYRQYGYIWIIWNQIRKHIHKKLQIILV